MLPVLINKHRAKPLVRDRHDREINTEPAGTDCTYNIDRLLTTNHRQTEDKREREVDNSKLGPLLVKPWSNFLKEKVTLPIPSCDTNPEILKQKKKKINGNNQGPQKN